ncbi:MAG TPA: HNH endonuclease signature motif containing protein [Ardenticatenaceae bacterium]|jgi:hypothetical protein
MSANPNYPFVAKRAEHRCEYCRAPEVIFNVPFEVDHIIPTSRGGGDEPQNWALACRACNLRKSNALDAIDPLTQKRTPLFNPRTEMWDEHFEIDEEAPSFLKARTAIGRATIDQLKMNAPLQRAARQQWIKLNLFP